MAKEDATQQFGEWRLSGFYRFIRFQINSTMNDKTSSLSVDKFHFTAGTNGIWNSTSTDLVNWGTATGNVFSSTNYSAWIIANFPGWSMGSLWAQDVIKMNGYDDLHHSVTDQFGYASPRSASRARRR